MTTDSNDAASADHADPTTEAERPTHTPTQRRRGRVPLRLVMLIAAVFAMLAVLGGGAGLVLGKIASAGVAHQNHETTFHEEHWHGPGPFGDVDQ
jgi:type VI protein secretion system component VasF